VFVDHRDRTADFDFALVEAAAGGGHVEGRFVGDIASHILDRAGDGVFAVQRALRTAEHFDALDIVNIQQRALRTRDVHVVDVNADAGLEAPQRVVLSHAANVGIDGAAGGAAGVDLDVRRERGHVFQCAHILGLQLIGGQRGNRHRHILQAFCTAARRDYDAFDAGYRCLLAGLGLGQRGEVGGENGGHRQAQCAARSIGRHADSPD
jgi:hypothetical protein